MSDVWGTVYQLDRDKATGNDPVSLRAEIERLRDEAGGVAMAAEQFGRQAESAKCEAEIARLRAALEAVEKWWLEDGMNHFTLAPYAIFAVREALKPTS